PHRLDAIARVRRERVRALQHPQIELAEWQPLLPELRGQEVAGEEPDEVLAALAVAGHHLDDAGRRLIGKSGFEDRASRTAIQRPIHELEEVVRPPLAIDGGLHQGTVSTIEGRAD